MAEVWATNVPSETERTITWKGDNYLEIIDTVKWCCDNTLVTFDFGDRGLMLTRRNGPFVCEWYDRYVDVGETVTFFKPSDPDKQGHFDGGQYR